MATLPLERHGSTAWVSPALFRTRTLFIFQLAFWTLFAALFFVLLLPRHPFADILFREALAAAVTGLASSAVLQRLHVRASARSAKFAVFVALPFGSVLLGLIWYALADAAGDVLDPFAFLFLYQLPGLELYAPVHIPAFAAILLLWSLLYVALVYRREQREQQDLLLKAEALAQEARLSMLRYQLNPHFLFNALNSIGALADEAPGRVQRMVGELSGFLRYSLLDSESIEVTLGDELRAAAHYLEVEKVRFEDHLEVRIALDPAAAACKLPAFLVLPLVDNAIKHGQRTSAMPLRIEISGSVAGAALQIEVKNTGGWVGVAQSSRSHRVGTHTGLTNVRERLRLHYERRHTFDVYEENGWVCARIRIDDAR